MEIFWVTLLAISVLLYVLLDGFEHVGGKRTLPGRCHVPAQRRHDRAHVRAQTSDRQYGGGERQRTAADERPSSHRLSRNRPAEKYGDQRVHIRVRRRFRGRHGLEQIDVRRESNQPAERDEKNPAEPRFSRDVAEVQPGKLTAQHADENETGAATEHLNAGRHRG